MKNIKKKQQQTEKSGLPCKSSARFVPVDKFRMDFVEERKKVNFGPLRKINDRP